MYLKRYIFCTKYILNCVLKSYLYEFCIRATRVYTIYLGNYLIKFQEVKNN